MFTTGKIYGHHLVINSATTDSGQTRVSFLDNNNAVVAPGAATKMRVYGLGDFTLADLRSTVANRARLGTKQVLDITAGGELVLTGVPAPNTKVFFKGRVINTRPTAQFNGYYVDKHDEFSYEIMLQPTDTVNNVLAKLYNAIKFESSRYDARFINVDGEAPTYVNTVTLVNNYATTATQVYLVAKEDSYRIEFDGAYGEDGNKSTYITTFAPAIVREQYEGVNHYRWMVENIAWENENTSIPHYIYEERRPIKGNLYSDLSFEKFTTRTDVYGHNVVDDITSQNNKFTMFVNENTCASLISDIATFLNGVVVPVAPKFAAHIAGVFTQNVTLAQYITNA